MRLLIPSLAHLWILSLSPRGAVLATTECKVVVPPTNPEFALLRVGKKALCAVKNESGSSCLTFLGDASEMNITELVLSDDLSTCEIKEASPSSPDSCIVPPDFDEDIFNGWLEDRDEEGNEDDGGGGGHMRRRLPSDTRCPVCEAKKKQQQEEENMSPLDKGIINEWPEVRDEGRNKEGRNMRRKFPHEGPCPYCGKKETKKEGRHLRRKRPNNGPCPFCSLALSLAQKSCFISPGNDRRLDMEGGNEKGKRGRKLPMQGQCPFCLCSVKSISIDNEDRFVLLQIQSENGSGSCLAYNHEIIH